MAAALVVFDRTTANRPELDLATVWEPSDDPDGRALEPDPEELRYSGGEDEFHYRGKIYVSSHDTLKFRARLEDV